MMMIMVTTTTTNMRELLRVSKNNSFFTYSPLVVPDATSLGSEILTSCHSCALDNACCVEALVVDIYWYSRKGMGTQQAVYGCSSIILAINLV